MSSKELVLITGASGMVAQSLANLLTTNGYEIRFLSRSKKAKNHFVWDIATDFIEVNALTDVQHIVHLAGANISEKRWTKKQKNIILESRVKSTQLLFKVIKQQNIALKTFISASAVGFYGTSKKDLIFKEDDLNGVDFLADVCKNWEEEADKFSTFKNIRVVKLRFSVVLASNEGALHKMMKPIKLGFGAVLGNGLQYIPWIHVVDLCRIILYSIENKAMKGVYNAVAPQHITNEAFTKHIAKKLDKKLWLPKAPAFVLKIILGEMATIVLNGNRVSCEKLVATGFTFQFPTIKKALDDLLE